MLVIYIIYVCVFVCLYSSVSFSHCSIGWVVCDPCYCGIYRGSYISAHDLLNVLNELGQRDKMRDLPSIKSLYCSE